MPERSGAFSFDKPHVFRVIQRDDGRAALAALDAGNEAAALQLPNHRDASVFALVQLLPYLFHGEEDLDVPVPVIVAVLPGDACPIQHQHIQELGFRRQEKEWRLHQESGKGHVAGDRCVLSDGNHFLVTSFRVDPSVFLD